MDGSRNRRSGSSSSQAGTLPHNAVTWSQNQLVSMSYMSVVPAGVTYNLGTVRTGTVWLTKLVLTFCSVAAEMAALPAASMVAEAFSSDTAWPMALRLASRAPPMRRSAPA